MMTNTDMITEFVQMAYGDVFGPGPASIVVKLLQPLDVYGKPINPPPYPTLDGLSVAEYNATSKPADCPRCHVVKLDFDLVVCGIVVKGSDALEYDDGLTF